MLRSTKPVCMTLILVCGMCAFIRVASGEEFKIGYINSEQIFSEYKIYSEAQGKFNEFRANWEKEALDKKAELQRLMDELQRQQLLLSDQRRKEMEQTIEGKAKEYERFVDEAVSVPDGKLARKQAELLKPVYDRINEVLQKIGEEDHYDFIFDAMSGLAFAKPEYDLTDRVLEELNKETE